mgnify:CR=1 FL=1
MPEPFAPAAALAWTALAPLMAGAAAFLVGPRAARALGLAAAALTLAAVAVVTGAVWSGGTLRHAPGGWDAPLGIVLEADALAALMLAMTAVVGAAVSVYAAAYFDPRSRDDAGSGAGFWPLWLTLWAGLNALFVSGDLFHLYVTLEVLGLASVALVALGGGAAVGAALRYLLVSIAGSLAYLLGLALLYAEYGTLALGALAAAAQPGPATWTAAALMSAGLALKTALFPLHFWLPPAHSSAPAPVSALLSALVVKASFYLVLRLWFTLAPAGVEAAAPVLGVLGAAAIVAGSLAALAQPRLKLLVAYSTVAQLGYLFVAFPLLAAGAVALQGMVLHALAHACAKAAMFMAAGNVLLAFGSDRLAELPRAGQGLRLSMTAFALAGVSLIGLPPSGGFLAKWLLLTAAGETGQWAWAAVLLAGSLLAAGYVFRALRPVFRDPESARAVKPLPLALELTPLIRAAAALALGLGAGAPLALLAARPAAGG